ncbi:hypothetical protein BT69DRAFT_500375 [Atractiella rhizophila]|nr:hypothetical protein BT69DRAFT_500375 [Atractiella rhizophila]
MSSLPTQAAPQQPSSTRESNLLNILLTPSASSTSSFPTPTSQPPASQATYSFPSSQHTPNLIHDHEGERQDDMLKLFGGHIGPSKKSSGEDLLKTLMSEPRGMEREGRALLEGLVEELEGGRESGMSGGALSAISGGMSATSGGSEVGAASFPSFPHSSLALPLQPTRTSGPHSYTFSTSSPSNTSEVPSTNSPSNAAKSPFDFISPFEMMERQFKQPAPRQPQPPTQAPAQPRKTSPMAGGDSLENESLPSTGSAKKTQRDEVVEDSPELIAARQKWMAKEYRDRGIEAFGGQKKTGFKMPPSSDPITIDCSKPLLESLYTQHMTLTAITLFATPVKMEVGRKMAATRDGFISYATKQGRVRVIDRNTGARLLLKSHSLPIIDMAVSKMEGRSLLSAGLRAESLATCGADGKLILWKVPSNFHDDTTEYRISTEIHSGNMGTFAGLQWHPTKPDVLAVRTTKGALAILDFEKDVSGKILNGRGPVAWEEAIKGQRLVVLPTMARLMTFSPDGTLLAVYTDDGFLSIRESDHPERVVFQSKHKLASPASSITGVEFLNAPGCHPRYISISRNNGTKVEVFELPNLLQSILQVNFTASQVAGTSLPPLDMATSLFCHTSFRSNVSTLFISNSLRASVFAFHVQFPKSSEFEKESNRTDADFIKQLVQQRPEASPLSPGILPTPFVDYVVEIPTVETVISFALDEVPASQERDDGAPISLFLSHPKGINQLYIDRAVVDPKYQPEQKAETEDEEGAGYMTRRMSLESSIQVQVETEVAVDGEKAQTGDEQPAELDVPEGINDASMMDLLGSPKEARLGDTPEVENDVSVSEMKLAGTVINGAIRTMKEKKEKSVPKSDFKEKEQTPSTSKRNEGEASTPSSKDLRKLEDNLTNKIGKLFTKEMDKFQQRAEEERASQNASELSRQENILRLVSNALSGNTKKLLESTVKAEIKNVVLPSISKIIADSVSDQISKGVAEALRKTLPNELERLLLRPDVSSHMSKHLGSSVAPLIERNVQTIIQQTIVPRFRDGTQAMLESLMNEVRSEMVDVRKEIVAEQSEILNGQENELRDLRDTVDGLRSQISNLERMVLRMQHGSNGQAPAHQDTQPVQPLHIKPHIQHAPRATGSSSSSQATPPSGKPSQIQPTKYIPQRPVTPTSQYEDLFLNVLSNPHNSLVTLIDQAPPHRLSAIFAGPSGKPVISQAVILTMAHKIAAELDSTDGKLLDTGRRRLSWLWYCIQSADVNDQTTAGYLGRIFNVVRTSLMSRQKKLEAIEDIDGAMAISEVINAVQAKIP